MDERSACPVCGYIGGHWHYCPNGEGGWFLGYCDGCELRTLQSVRTVRGGWGTATVCEFHRDHV